MVYFRVLANCRLAFRFLQLGIFFSIVIWVWLLHLPVEKRKLINQQFIDKFKTIWVNYISYVHSLNALAFTCFVKWLRKSFNGGKSNSLTHPCYLYSYSKQACMWHQWEIIFSCSLLEPQFDTFILRINCYIETFDKVFAFSSIIASHSMQIDATFE